MVINASPTTLQTKRPSSPPSPPVVRGLPIIGSSRALIRDPFGFFPKMYKEYGPVFKVQALGNHYLTLAGIDANRVLAQTNDETISGREVFATVSKNLKTEHFMPGLNGAIHRHWRKMVRPHFTPQAVNSYIPTIVQSTNRMAATWKSGQMLPVKSTMQMLVCEQLGLSMMNYPMGAQFKDAVTFSETLFGAGAAHSLPLMMLHLPPYVGAKARLTATLKQLLAERQARVISEQEQGQRHPDLLDSLLSAHYPDGQALSEQDRTVTAFMPYVAGVGQTAPSCGLLLYELLKRPALLEQVTAEVDATYAQGFPSAEDLAPGGKLQTLYGAMMEILRIYPVAIVTPRSIVNEMEFLNYHIPAGQMVFFANTVTHFLEEFFPDPYTFDVNRYYPPRNEHVRTNAFTPFTLGPHSCVADRLAKVVVALTVGTILYNVRLELESPDYTLKVGINPVPAPERKFKVRVTERRPATPMQ